MKRVVADKWSPEVLERIAAGCKIASNAQTIDDWNLFLSAIYDSISLLPPNQRIIFLLSQEHGLSFSDIGRTMNLPHSTVKYNMMRAVGVVVEFLEKRSLMDTRIKDKSPLMREIFSGYCEDKSSRIVSPDHYDLPYYSDSNPLQESEDGYEDPEETAAKSRRTKGRR